jgi:hypothetical protein
MPHNSYPGNSLSGGGDRQGWPKRLSKANILLGLRSSLLTDFLFFRDHFRMNIKDELESLQNYLAIYFSIDGFSNLELLKMFIHACKHRAQIQQLFKFTFYPILKNSKNK